MPDYIRRAEDAYFRLRADEIQMQRYQNTLEYQEQINALQKRQNDQAVTARRKSLKRQQGHERRDSFIQELMLRYEHDEEFRKFVDSSFSEGAAALRRGYLQLKAWKASNLPGRP
jgi:hypothetical protein